MSDFSESQIPGTIEENEDAVYHFHLSSGGSSSFLAGIGAVMGCHAAGITKFRSFTGVSAGSIPSALLACGYNSQRLTHLGLKLEFDKHLGLIKELLYIWKALGVPNNNKAKNSCDSELREARYSGVLGTESLGECMEQLTAESRSCWPKAFWTMATTRKGQPVVFKGDGVFLLDERSGWQQLSDKPVSLVAAVRMSCSIPIIIASMRYKGMLLYDGALSRDGVCPVGMQIRHLGVEPGKIIACYHGDNHNEPIYGKLHALGRLGWGVSSEQRWGAETAEVIDIHPNIQHVHTLKFHLSRDAKWLAILLAFDACTMRLAREGILRDDRLAKVQNLFRDLGAWRSSAPAPPGSAQVFSARVESCLTEYGLY